MSLTALPALGTPFSYWVASSTLRPQGLSILLQPAVACRLISLGALLSSEGSVGKWILGREEVERAFREL